jgi:hypothetical protein
VVAQAIFPIREAAVTVGHLVLPAGTFMVSARVWVRSLDGSPIPSARDAGCVILPDNAPAIFQGNGLDESSATVAGYHDGTMTLFVPYSSNGGTHDPHGVQVRCWGQSNTANGYTDMVVQFVRIEALQVSDVSLQ